MSSTTLFALSQGEEVAWAQALLALWDRLSWRHAGFGALQAYVREGGASELRVHVWHPDLVRPGIVESGLCHDHRFAMRSRVLLGAILQTEFFLEHDPAGPWETHKVLHARAAQAAGGSFHQEPVPTGNRYRRLPRAFRVPAGLGYTFERFAFHESQCDGLTITLVEKIDQIDVNARILAPVGQPIVHAFAEPLPERATRPVLEAARGALAGLVP